MKNYLVVQGVLFALLIICSFNVSAQKGKKVVMKNFNDSVSYAIGVDIAQNFEKQEISLNPDMIAKGMSDYIAKTPQLNDEMKQQVIIKFQQELQSKQVDASTKKAEENKKAGKAYLDANKMKDGIGVTPSGLQYKVIKEGTGPKPKATDIVKVHYRGKLLNGTVFDASYDRGEPAEFPLNQVIKGWTEGLQLMSAGSMYEFYIPSELAYGDRGAGEVIPPGAALIFEVELISFKKAEEVEEAPVEEIEKE